MNEILYYNGRKTSYDHEVDDDGYDVITNVVDYPDITVIGGIEYEIAEDAPEERIYGFQKQKTALLQSSADVAVYTEYDYITGEWTRYIPVTDSMVTDGRGPYVPPTPEEKLTFNEDGTLDTSWTKNDYLREIQITKTEDEMKELEAEYEAPVMNFRPPEPEVEGE